MIRYFRKRKAIRNRIKKADTDEFLSELEAQYLNARISDFEHAKANLLTEIEDDQKKADTLSLNHEREAQDERRQLIEAMKQKRFEVASYETNIHKLKDVMEQHRSNASEARRHARWMRINL